MNAIVITTINNPTDAIKQFSKLSNFKLFIAGDNKSPKDWELPNSTYLPIEKQRERFPQLSSSVAENHYARKNLAYAEAIKSGALKIYETDDDNFPYDFFPNFLLEEKELKQIRGPLAFNIYSLFTKKSTWPRGLPLNYIHNKDYSLIKKHVIPLIQQSLADLDPDVDAIYRLTIGKEIIFDKNKIYSIKKGTYVPFNSQNTFWDKSVFPLMYLPSTVSNRATDIWRGYIAQRIIWELNSEMIYLSPSVYQKRNIHNFMHDFNDEVEVFLGAEKIIQELQSLDLKGGVSDMLMQIYLHLHHKGFFAKKEVNSLKHWLSLFN